MSNEKIIALLETFHANNLAKSLEKLQVGKWQILMVNNGEEDISECMVKLPISANFIIILDSANTTHQTISDVNQKIDECLSKIKDHFYTYAVHTKSSFKSYFIDNNLSDGHIIDQCLAKADSLKNISEKFFAENEEQHKKKLKNLDFSSATLLSMVGSWKGPSDEKSSLPSAEQPSEAYSRSPAQTSHC